MINEYLEKLALTQFYKGDDEDEELFFAFYHLPRHQEIILVLLSIVRDLSKSHVDDPSLPDTINKALSALVMVDQLSEDGLSALKWQSTEEFKKWRIK